MAFYVGKISQVEKKGYITVSTQGSSAVNCLRHVGRIADDIKNGWTSPHELLSLFVYMRRVMYIQVWYLCMWYTSTYNATDSMERMANRPFDHSEQLVTQYIY